MHTCFEHVGVGYVFEQCMNTRSAHRGDGLVAESPLGHVASLQTLERRILALEARLADVEGGYGETLFKLHRASVKTDLRMSKILNRFDIPDVSDEEVDAAMDEA
jgi:hypothetical protein